MTTVRTSGFSFIAVESVTGVKHLMYSEHFEHFSYPPPIRRTLCGRKVEGHGWHEISAHEWYTEPRQCQLCGPSVGPYATIRL